MNYLNHWISWCSHKCFQSKIYVFTSSKRNLFPVFHLLSWKKIIAAFLPIFFISSCFLSLERVSSNNLLIALWCVHIKIVWVDSLIFQFHSGEMQRSNPEKTVLFGSQCQAFSWWVYIPLQGLRSQFRCVSRAVFAPR